MKTPYMGWHNHDDRGSNARLRDSIIKVPDLIEYAHSIGMKGICITDHESISAAKLAQEIMDTHKGDPEWEDFKLGLGNEIYLCNRPDPDVKLKVFPHFLLLALDDYGHEGIRELSTNSWVNNSFMDVMYRVPTYYDNLEDMLEKFKGHIIGSTACIGSPLDRKLLQYQAYGEDPVIWDACVGWIEYMNDIFGKGNFFLELQPNDAVEQVYVNDKLIKLSKETGTPYVITTDAHYLTKQDKNIHATFLKSQNGEREVEDFYATTYVMTSEEIHEYMDKYIGADAVDIGLKNTLVMWDRVQEYHFDRDLHIPYLPRDTREPDAKLYGKYKDKIPLLKEFFFSEADSDRHMTRRMLEEFERNQDYQNDEAFASINECLDYTLKSSIKNNTHWSAYFMNVADYTDICWECDSVVAPGRGSGVGFGLLNTLGIIQINPLKEKTKTYPWRFLNPERMTVLDIDTDIMPSRRDDIIYRFGEIYGFDRVAKVLTYTTEGPRQAILTAARGLGTIDNDTASYIASLVIFDRGQARSLKTMYYGNDEYEPSAEFIREMDAHPELWAAAQKIEGLVSGVGSHAGGVIIVDEPFTKTTSLMRTKSGDIVTAFDLHECERCSLIKIDLLATDYCSKVYVTLMLLIKDGVIEWQGSLRDTYEKYIGVYTLERDAEDMWKMLWDHKVLSLFQMEKDSGKKALALVKPHSVDDLATINSVIRLMAQEKGAESPLEKFARFHEDITLWYKEMEDAGLTQEEQDILKGILGVSYGICEAQEYLVLLTMHPAIGGFDLQWGDRLRKAVAKKKPKDFNQLQKEFFENRDKKGLSKNLTNYVWNVLIMTQRGYGFNKSHTLAYSVCGLQELNLAYKYNIIYWNCANLIVDSGALDETENDSTDYGKIGIAIAKIQQEGVPVELPLVNEAEFGFKPDIPNDRIIFGLKGINGINTQISQAIIENRPYSSIEDFMAKIYDTGIVKKAGMLKLIKAGCFTELHSKDRAETMRWFLKHYVFKPLESLTLNQFNRLVELKLIPGELEFAQKCVFFKRYVLSKDALFECYIDATKKMNKKGYHDRYFILDENSQPFFMANLSEESIIRINGDYFVISEKKFEKEIDKLIDPLKTWFSKPETLNLYNDVCFEELVKDEAKGDEAKWNMDALSFYQIGKNELQNVDEEKYGIVNFFELPDEPEPYSWYTRYIEGQPKQIPKYKISCIAGTVINADNNHHQITLSTKYGPVNVKVNKGKYAYYKKAVSVIGDDGKKHTIENSWFKRGTLLRICGFKRDDQFWPLNYADTIYSHTINRITEVLPNGELALQFERSKGEMEEDE